MTRAQKIIFYLFLALLIFLVFFRLGRHDMLTDDGHYAFRSLGYFDYVASLEQTTPVQWFSERPWWSYLGFHDHPPLFFLIQHIFFKLFGASIVVSRLPSALASIGTAIAVFFIGRKLGNIRAGLISLGALTLNSYFIWTGRVGLLESVFTFFLCLGLYYFIKALETDPKYFVYGGLYWGFAILTKYTFLFFVPAILVYILWKKPQIFKNRKFWAGIAVFVILCLPILIYNFGMLAARGHFDVQFSDFFGQDHNDWPKLVKRVNFGSIDPAGVFNTLLQGFSWPYFAVFALSFLGALFLFRKSPKILVMLMLASPLVFFFFIGGAERWLGVLTPFAALIIGLAVVEVWRERNYVMDVSFILLGLFFLFYTLNTNHFIVAKGHKLLYASFRLENYGYNQLDKRISKLLDGKRSAQNIQEVVNTAWYGQIRPEAINFPGLHQGEDFKAVIVYDSNSAWFAAVWIFERWKLYRRFFIPSAEEFIVLNNMEQGQEILRSLKPIEFFFIESGPLVKARADISFPESEKLVEKFQNKKVVPELIYDNQGREAFYIYHGVLN